MTRKDFIRIATKPPAGIMVVGQYPCFEILKELKQLRELEDKIFDTFYVGKPSLAKDN